MENLFKQFNVDWLGRIFVDNSKSQNTWTGLEVESSHIPSLLTYALSCSPMYIVHMHAHKIFS